MVRDYFWLVNFHILYISGKIIHCTNNQPWIYMENISFLPIFFCIPTGIYFLQVFLCALQTVFWGKRTHGCYECLGILFSAHSFINWVAPVLGLFGGIIFARTYKKTKSLLMVSIEHSLYGNALFVLGLGWFFWGGSVG